MKQDTYNGMKRVIVNLDLMWVFVITNNTIMKKNAGVNVKNWLIKANVIKDLFGIQVIWVWMW